MRILIHMGDPFSDNSPNSKRMTSFAREFVDSGHVVSVISPKYIDDVKYGDVNIVSCPMIDPKKKSSIGRLISQFSIAVGSLFASLKVGKCDVVITSAPPALISPAGWLIAKFKRASLVYDVRDIWPDVALEMGSFEKGSIYEKVFRRVRDFMTKRADLITAVSPGKVKKLERYSKGKEVLFISNGFDNEFLNNSVDVETVSKYRLDDGFNCVYVGKLGLAQGLSKLLDLAHYVKNTKPDVRFLLFGSGVEAEALEEQKEKYDLSNVEFCGKIPNDKIYTVLKYADLCYVPLVNGNLKDSIPTKLYEALGIGCPVLLSAQGDSADVLEKTGLGISVSPNDPDALKNAFEYAYSKSDWEIEKQTAAELMTTVYSRQTAAKKMERELSLRFEKNRERDYIYD